jgi:hypothetical protein
VKKRKISKKIIYTIIVVVVLGLLFLIARPFLFWKTLEVKGEYSIKYPSTWHYNSQPEFEGRSWIISNYKGNLSTQDRASENEFARVTVGRLLKKNFYNIEELANRTTSYYPQATIKKVKTSIDGLPAIRISIDNSSQKTKTFFAKEEYLVVEKGDKIYEISGGYYPDIPHLISPYYSRLIKKIIGSISFKNN